MCSVQGFDGSKQDKESFQDKSVIRALSAEKDSDRSILMILFMRLNSCSG